MKTNVIVLTAASLALSACGWRDSSLNPGNWFGSSEPVQSVAADGSVNALIPPERGGLLRRPEAADLSVPIASVTKLQIDPTPSGAIILAEGVASRQGAFAAELRPVNPELVSDDGILELDFRVAYPPWETPVGDQRSRTVVDAYTLSRQDLSAVRLVRVRGAQNALESRRR
ncbi:hypothetical protein QO034_13670 [Sedimentitalea sp. JM2-8]|uniref:Lipoprotein n=1 Tax=Sedimentitalea xiamensis TaxID=3050037 RepID=A0ABT7FGT1_9RHOB|nr:hypothetical protein [Sedimentitalea xiamensis]MDK3074163.1 hypothetical protein [Sedimentitalea xiamensis]